MASKREIILQLKHRLMYDLIEQKDVAILTNLKWGSTSQNITFDLAIKKNALFLVIFEIILSKNSYSVVLDAPDKEFNLTGALYYIRYFPKSEDNKYMVFKRHQGSTTSDLKLIQRYDGVIKIIRSIFESINKIQEDKDIVLLDKTIDFFVDGKTRVLDPDWCRKQLDTFRDKRVCRYSSLDSLFSTITYKTIRMNGLPGMNDRVEGLFAWSLINDVEKTDNKENKRRKKSVNNAFIVSYSKSIMIDNLTQWRLYGDDAKGVCCVYSVKQEIFDDRFFLHPVKYMKKIKADKYEQDNVIKAFKAYARIYPYPDFSPLIFFYKPNDFESEKEIRLLFDNKETDAYKSDVQPRKWLLTNSNNIPNPYIDIPLEKFPLKLEKIILGPNMNDVDTIQVQLESLLEQEGIKAVVELSDIKSYRNPND